MLDKTRSTVVHKTMLITPDMAKTWLEGNIHNRELRHATVVDYAADMKAKKWRLNGEAIIFDANKKLADGQHRLYACWESGASFESVVVFGVDPDSFATIDTGRKRSAADVLHIAGHKSNETSLAAAAALVLKYRAGTLFQNTKVSPEQILALVASSPQLCSWVEAARSGSGYTKSYASPVAAVMFLGSRKFHKEAEDFLAQFKSGSDLGAGSPVLALRNRLMSPLKRDTKVDRFALVISAWNNFAQGKKITRVQLFKGDVFPKIVGAK